MARTYPKDNPQIKPEPIDDEQMLDIGRLVRACADFEVILDFYLMRLCKLDIHKYHALIGRQPIRSKISCAIAIASDIGGDEKAAAKKVFTATVDQIIEARNNVAHGAYIGKTEDGRLAFSLPPAVREDGVLAGRLAYLITKDALRAHGQLLIRNLQPFGNELQVGALIGKFQQAPILAHPLSRPKQKEGKKPRTRPPPSPK